MVNLMLHCGSRAVKLNELKKCPTPERTKTWVPIPHHHLLEQVERTLEGNQLEVVNQAHALSPDGARYFGLLEVVNGQSHADYSLVLGLRNSHDRQFPAGIAVGSAVFICDNLAFSGEVTLARRHTVNIMRDLPQLVQSTMAKLSDMRQLQDRRIETYQQTEVDDHQAHDLAIRALDARVLPVTQLPRAIDEWRKPSHAEFEEGGKTAWRFFNAVTETIKGRNLDQLPKRTQALHGLLDTCCGLNLATSN